MKDETAELYSVAVTDKMRAKRCECDGILAENGR